MIAIDDAELSFLTQLLATPAPSGFEEPVARLWMEQFSGFDSVSSDRIGNAFATVNSSAGPHVAIVGHLDEIGLIVTKVESQGVLRCQPIGGWDATVLVGQRVRVLTDEGALGGVIGRRAIHQLRQEERTKVPEILDLWIDVGAESAEELKALVAVGTPVVLESAPARVGEHRLISRSLDNRVGCYVAAEVAKRSQGIGAQVTAIASVQEEIGAVGALCAGFSLQPDAAIVVDVTAATDVPGGSSEPHVVELGKGPVLSRGSSTNARVVQELIDVARETDIPVQLRGLGRRTATDADALVRSGAGIACGLVSIPGRYLHSPGEMVDLRDISATIELITAWVDRRSEAAG